MNYELLNFKVNADDRGCLVPLEANKDIPFSVNRIFYIYGTKGDNIVRGRHANRQSSFVLVMLAGSCKINIYDNDGNYETVVLDSPEKGLYLKNMTFKEMYDFTDNAVMICITDKHFDKDEYIDTYEEFLKEVKNG